MSSPGPSGVLCVRVSVGEREGDTVNIFTREDVQACTGYVKGHVGLGRWPFLGWEMAEEG